MGSRDAAGFVAHALRTLTALASALEVRPSALLEDDPQSVRAVCGQPSVTSNADTSLRHGLLRVHHLQATRSTGRESHAISGGRALHCQATKKAMGGESRDPSEGHVEPPREDLRGGGEPVQLVVGGEHPPRVRQQPLPSAVSVTCRVVRPNSSPPRRASSRGSMS